MGKKKHSLKCVCGSCVPRETQVPQGKIKCDVCGEPLAEHGFDTHLDLVRAEYQGVRNDRVVLLSPAERKRRERKRKEKQK